MTGHDDGETKIARRSNHLPQLALRSGIQTLHQINECESPASLFTTLPTVVGSSRNTSDGLPMKASAALTFLLFPPLRKTIPPSPCLSHSCETLPQSLHLSILVHIKTEQLQHILTHGRHLRRLHTFQSREREPHVHRDDGKRGGCSPSKEQERLANTQIIDEPIKLRAETDLHCSTLHQRRMYD